MNIELLTWRDSIIDCLKAFNIHVDTYTHQQLSKIDNADILKTLYKEMTLELSIEKESTKAESIKRKIIEASEACKNRKLL